MVEAMPDLEDRTATPPGGPGLARIRCLFCFKYEDPELVHSRCPAWWIENAREKYYNMNKEYSRVVSKLAIPRLVNEMNNLRDPQKAAERFMLISLGLEDISGIDIEQMEKDLAQAVPQ